MHCLLSRYVVRLLYTHIYTILALFYTILALFDTNFVNYLHENDFFEGLGGHDRVFVSMVAAPLMHDSKWDFGDQFYSIVGPDWSI